MMRPSQRPAPCTQHNSIQQNTPHDTETLQQKATPLNIHKDHNNSRYDPWSNGWGHKIQKDTTGIFRLFTKTFTSISPPQGQVNSVKLTPSKEKISTFGAGALTGQELCIDFKIQEQAQDIKCAYMKHFQGSRTAISNSMIPVTDQTYLLGGALLTTFNKFRGRVIDTGLDPMER